MSEHPTLVCLGCKTPVSTGDPTPFRCPLSEDGGDHVLRAPLEPGLVDPTRVERAFRDPNELNPFLRFRDLLVVYRAARARGVSDADYETLFRTPHGLDLVGFDGIGGVRARAVADETTLRAELARSTAEPVPGVDLLVVPVDRDADVAQRRAVTAAVRAAVT